MNHLCRLLQANTYDIAVNNPKLNRVGTFTECAAMLLKLLLLKKLKKLRIFNVIESTVCVTG